jgi:hypothetical protein
VVADIGIKESRITDAALGTWIILSRTRLPIPVFRDMDLASRMMVSEETSGYDWNRVFEVVNTGE